MPNGNLTLKVFKTYKRKRKRGTNARKRKISIEEYIRLHGEAVRHLRGILTVGFYTGMRAGEIRELKWSYVDVDSGMIRFPLGMTKEGKLNNVPKDSTLTKDIPITEPVKNVLNSQPRALHHDFVFTYRTKPIGNNGSFKKSFKNACDRANIPHGRKTPNGITFHDIRRSVKTYMLSAGVDKVHRDLIVGHSLKGMDIHYMAPSEKDLKEAANKYAEWISDQILFIDQSNDQVQKTGTDPKENG
jgi:integrase